MVNQFVKIVRETFLGSISIVIRHVNLGTLLNQYGSVKRIIEVFGEVCTRLLSERDCQ